MPGRLYDGICCCCSCGKFGLMVPGRPHVVQSPIPMDVAAAASQVSAPRAFPTLPSIERYSQAMRGKSGTCGGDGGFGQVATAYCRPPG